MSSPRDLRPLSTTAAAAVFSTGLLVLSVSQGWLGADVGRGANFCEAARNGLLKQPANTVSNAGFVLAGLLVAWRAGRRSDLGDTLPRHPGLPTSYAVVLVLLGPASAAMHATQSSLGGHLDLLSMYLIASFAAAYAVMRLLGQSTLTFVQVGSLFVAGCVLVEAAGAGREVPVVLSTGNLAFGTLLIVAVTLEVVLWRRGGERTDLRYGAAALASIVIAFVIWNLSKARWCDPDSLLQGHAAWHLLCAVAAYFLFRLYASAKGHVLVSERSLT